MPKVTVILVLTSVAFAYSAPQLAWQGREPGLSIAQQIGDGIKNVPIPPPWYFLKNKYYRNTNGFISTTEGSPVSYNSGKIANGVSPDLASRFNTDKPNPTAKIPLTYIPYSTTPTYRIPNAWSSSTTPVFASTTRAPPQFIYSSYRPSSTTAAPSTLNYISSTQSAYPIPNQSYVPDPPLRNGHSRPINTSETPSFVSETTEVSKLPSPTFEDLTDPSGLQLQSSTIEPLEKEKGQENSLGIEATTVLSESATLTQNDLLNDTTNDSISDDRRTTTKAEVPVNNAGLLFSGPQICKKRNAYFGVGENHSFYVECQDYQPALKLCPDNFNFESNVQWPEYPCKQATTIENQAQKI